MRYSLRAWLPLAMLVFCLGFPAEAAVMSFSSTGSFPTADVQLRPVRPIKPGFPTRSPMPGKSTTPTTVRYSQSAWAANMVMPAIWLGLPTIVIIALIIRSMKGD
jgi:hypothetical protein